MTTWVLLRGLSREAAHWGDFTARMQASVGPDDRVLALDLPGTGRYHLERSPATVEAIAAVCRARLEALAPGPCVLVALSLGGMVALQWVHDAPGPGMGAAAPIVGCVLINTSLRGHSAFWQRLRPRNYPRLLWLLLAAMFDASAARRERAVLGMTSAVPARHPGAVACWSEIARARPVSAGNILRQLLAAARYAAPARAPRVPVLVLASRGDGLVSHACSAGFARGHSLPLRLHAWAGHDLPLDDPDWVLREIAAWRGGIALSVAQAIAAGPGGREPAHREG